MDLAVVAVSEVLACQGRLGEDLQFLLVRRS